MTEEETDYEWQRKNDAGKISNFNSQQAKLPYTACPADSARKNSLFYHRLHNLMKDIAHQLDYCSTFCIFEWDRQNLRLCLEIRQILSYWGK